MTDVAVVERPSRREIATVIDPIPTLDTARFEHMQRIANVMARSTMIPETLRTVGPKDHKEDLPVEQVMANCFLVVNQAVRWGMDPFAVVSCCSVVYGRLSYEGKLVAAVLDAKLSVQLEFHFTGDPTSEAFRIYISDHPFTDEIIAKLRPGISIPGFRLWDGSVAEWKTTGAGTPWTQKNYKRMLIYRGTRDWTRIYEPAIMLGVYTEDELIELADDARARRSAPIVSLAERLAIGRASQEPANGFSEAHVKQELQPSTAEAAPAAADQSSAEADGGVSQVSASAPSNSSPGSAAAPQLTPEPGTKPASEREGEEPATTDAGTSKSPVQVSPTAPAGEERQATESGHPAHDGGSAGLPEGLRADWKVAYAQALGRAQKIGSLSRISAEFWREVPYEKIKGTPLHAEERAIYSLFTEYFGEAWREKREGELRKLGALQ